MKVTKIFLKKKNGKGVKYYRENHKNLPEDKKQKIAEYRKYFFFQNIFFLILRWGLEIATADSTFHYFFFWGGLFLTSNVGWCAGPHESKSFIMCAHCNQWLGFFWNKTNYLMIYKYFVYLFIEQIFVWATNSWFYKISLLTPLPANLFCVAKVSDHAFYQKNYKPLKQFRVDICHIFNF